jgi:hypothetical protein
VPGWRESGEQIIELGDQCANRAAGIFREANSEATNEHYARRAEHYQLQADHLRELAAGRD